MSEEFNRKENGDKWLSYWEKLNQTTASTEQIISTKVYALDAGGLGFEVALLSTFKGQLIGIILAVLSALAFSVSIILNLVSQTKSKKFQDGQRRIIADYLGDANKVDDSYIYQEISLNNTGLQKIDNTSIAFSIFAIVVLFIAIVITII